MTHTERVEQIREQLDRLTDELPSSPMQLLTNPGSYAAELLAVVDNIHLTMRELAADVDRLNAVKALPPGGKQQ